MNPDIGQANLAFACALVDELAAQGLRHAVVCPGSRSTPVAVALAFHPGIRAWVLVDERSAAFFALGMARSLAEPVALLCTSGTAAANFLPAVAEAHLSRIPLVVLTADRPPELRDWGAAQTIDQAGMYGSHATWAADLPVPGVPHQARQARAFAARAWNSALTAPAGPVHLNLPFREPLLPISGDLRHEADRCFAAERYSVAEPAFGPGSNGISNHDAEAVATVLAGEPRGIIVCGPESIPDPRFPSAVADLSAATGYPVLADALSGVRFGPHDRAGIIDAYDGFVRHPDLIPGLLPDVVIRTGAIPTSKPLQLFLARSAAKHHILVDPGDPRDPSHLATTHLRANPAEALSEIAAAVRARGAFPDAGWRRCWSQIDAVTAAASTDAMAECGELFEGRVVAEVASLLPEGATLVTGNSMPVRDLDTFLRGDGRAVRLRSNRGANGIDGVMSSALGEVAVSCDPVLLVVGDLSFYHDLNGLLAARKFGLNATVVVLNNNGGGIFSFLPQAEQLDEATFEALFGTPIDLNIAEAARLYRAHYACPADWDAFRETVQAAIAGDGLHIIEVRTDRRQNAQLHREVSARVAAALQSADARVGHGD